MNRWILYALSGLLIAGAAAFLLATSVFAVGRSGVFGTHDYVYFAAAGYGWLHGLSPYNLETINQASEAYLANIDGVSSTIDNPIPYLPQFFPFAVIAGGPPFEIARGLFAALNLAAIATIAVAAAWCFRTSVTYKEAPWLVLALAFTIAQAIGTPFASHNVWMGQTTALAAALVMLGWMLAASGKPWLGCAILALSVFKPIVGLLILPLAVFKWPKQALIVFPIVMIATAAYPLLRFGPIEHTQEWLSSVRMYGEIEANKPDAQHAFGIRSLLMSVGIPSPNLVLIAIVGLGLMIYNRAKLTNAELLVYGLVLPPLFFRAHDPGLVVLAPMIGLMMAYYLRSLPALLAIVFASGILFFPMRLVSKFDGPAIVERYREIVVLIFFVCMLFSTLKRLRSSSSTPALAAAEKPVEAHS